MTGEEEDANSKRRPRKSEKLGVGLRVGGRVGGWGIKVEVVAGVRRESTGTDDGKLDDVTGIPAELSEDKGVEGGRDGVGGGGGGRDEGRGGGDGGGEGETMVDDNGCGRERWAGQRHGRPLLEYWSVHVSSEATRIVAIESTSLVKFVGKEAGD